MKKLLSMLLVVVMLFAFVPAAIAEEAPFTLAIGGGAVPEHFEKVNGEDLLAVKVVLKGTAAETVYGLTFELTYDPAQLTFVKCAAGPKFALPTFNDTVSGELRLAIVAPEGVVTAEHATVMTVYFKVADGMQLHDRINLGIKDGATAETTDVNKPTYSPIASECVEYEYFYTFDGTIEWNPEDVRLYGTNYYVVANGEAQTPRFIVKYADGTEADPADYDFEYRENTEAGTGYVFVTFKNDYRGTYSKSFKIYLPATSSTTIANVKAGVRVYWKAVPGAGGYVVYRRTYNAKTKKWSKWGRLGVTEALNYTDTKAVAGTKYQYAMRPYLPVKIDPVTGEEMGGPSDTANYGVTGAKKMMVRLTSVTLKSVTAGSKRMTVKWTTSKLVNGYQIQYATNSTFTKGLKSVKVTSPKTASKVIKNLKKGTTYYVRVRGYKVVSSVTYYSGWTAMKTCKVK